VRVRAKADVAVGIDEERIVRCARAKGERDLRVVEIFEVEPRVAAGCLLIRGKLPVIRGESRRIARVFKLQPYGVCLQLELLVAKRFAVGAVETDAGRAVDDEIVGDHVVERADRRESLGRCFAGGGPARRGSRYGAGARPRLAGRTGAAVQYRERPVLSE